MFAVPSTVPQDLLHIQDLLGPPVQSSAPKATKVEDDDIASSSSESDSSSGSSDSEDSDGDDGSEDEVEKLVLLE
jgi:hypothetical protein